MNRTLLTQALIKFLAGILLIGLLVFLPAGSFAYWQGWLLMGVLFIPMFFAGIVMLAKNPDLLRKRLNAKEKEGEQKAVVALSGLLFTLAFVTAGLNWRFDWWMLPDWTVWTAAALFILSYLLYAEVLRENEYLSRTIEVQEGQKVIDTGLYGIVRHPMYLAVSLLYIAIPLVLGSWWALLPMSLCVLLLLVRIKNEELLLHQGLPGYTEYTKRVQYRMIPFLW